MEAVKNTAFILLVFYCPSVLIIGIVSIVGGVTFDDPQPGNQVCLYFLCICECILVIFSIISLCYRAKEKISTLYFYPFSFVTCFHFLWASLGLFSNRLWALPILLIILTTIFLIFFCMYSKVLLNNNWCSFVPFLLLVFFTFISYVTFTWISARFFFTSEFISGLIQTLLIAGVGLAAPIWKLKKDTDKLKRDTDSQTTG